VKETSILYFFEVFALNSGLFAPACRQAGFLYLFKNPLTAKKIPRYRKARKENYFAEQIITLTKRYCNFIPNNI